MKASIIAAIAISSILALPTSSMSGEVNHSMPNNYYDGVAAKLYSSGYREVRLVDQEAQLLSAYDGDGSEVLIVVGAANRKVLSVIYVRDADE